MSKLRNAVSRARLKSLGQDVEPPKADEPPKAPKADEPPKPVQARPQRRKRRARAVALGSHLPANGNAGNDKEAADEEPQAIRDARVRLRALITQATKDAPKPSVGIVLAIVNQETGNHAAANALIDELGLEKLFGIKKFCRDDLTG